ncbi:MAG: quaternary ammonium compound efflux SMR transporter SugE [Gammaproteobacteria bacterium]|nr:quaternary ammonium compound efflux SMR transporter SugE [Gammaproteobacteria bacterium]
MNWMILILAGLLEVGWAVGLKYTEGFSRLWPSLGVALAIAASMFLLAIAMRTLPVSTAYAVWTGIGIAGTAIFGVVMLGESMGVVKLLSLGLIVAGIAGLKFTG